MALFLSTLQVGRVEFEGNLIGGQSHGRLDNRQLKVGDEAPNGVLHLPVALSVLCRLNGTQARKSWRRKSV